MDIGVYQAVALQYNSGRGNVSLLQAETQRNYQAVQNYYFQKKMMFLRFAAKKENESIEKIEDELVNSMDNLIQQVWGQINDSILGALDIGANGKYNFKQGINQFDTVIISKYIIKRLETSLCTTKNIYSELGFAYEEFLEQAMHGLASSVASAGLADILSGFTQTGGFKANSSIRADMKDIRPDLGYGITKQNAEEAELQVLFDVSNYYDKMSANEKDLENYPEQLLKYLQSDMFGMSVKRWTSTEGGHKLTQASGMAAKINATYEASLPKSWNFTYAYHTMLLIISRYLLDILGPTNVAYITGTGFTWANDFLSNALLSMNIYTQKKYKNNEGRPYIASGNIYINNYAQGRMNTMASAQYTKQTFVKGNNWNAYKLNFKIS